MEVYFVNTQTGEKFKTVYNGTFVNLNAGDEFIHTSKASDKTTFQDAKVSRTTHGVVTKNLFVIDDNGGTFEKHIHFDPID